MAETTVNELVSSLRSQRDWVHEINSLSLLIEKLESMGKVTSTRELAKILDKSKSWIAISLVLAKGLRVYPEIEKMSNRNKAYLFLQRKQKQRKFLD